MHFDLLTKLYMCYKQNDFSFIENWSKSYNDGNVKGLIANLCFMSIDEMQEEYDPNYYDPKVSVVEMFKISTDLLKKYLPSDILVLTSIEGCDFLNVDDLDQLKKLGLNAILPVWNNENKYGSGNRSEKGLTIEGEHLIKKTIELNIDIDLSHANEKTFFDIINIIKKYRENGIYPTVYASHSNVRVLCDRQRNLTNKQIVALNEVDGLIGVMSNCNFVLEGSLNKKISLTSTSEYDSYIDSIRKMYINHIVYISKLLGSVDNICLSTDDMTFSGGDPEYKYTPIFEYNMIKDQVKSYLQERFSIEDTNKIMYGNAVIKLFDKQKQKNIS